MPAAPKSALTNISVEEENLGAIPFAVLERRVGKRIGKLELKGTKTLPDGTRMNVLWQVQGNNELGLPTEKDLDIFIALGMLTFQSNFSKTITFTGREIAQLLGISSIHGKFYQRLKLAMDRFIPLRFRALASTDRHETIKWMNVFQEASFTLDHATGRCTGTVTWTDKIIQTMNAGLFRLLDAGRYFELDGITAKHLYRFLAMAFESTDLLLIDARKLATENLGILDPPKYLSRLLQTLEPAFEQLIKIEVLASYHVVSSKEWKLALRRHPNYVPKSTALLTETAEGGTELRRAQCIQALEHSCLPAALWEAAAATAGTIDQFYVLRRLADLANGLEDEGVSPAVIRTILRDALDQTPAQEGPGRDLLDWCEMALETSREKRKKGQHLRNAAGFIVKLIKDADSRARFISADTEQSFRARFRQREQAVVQQDREMKQYNRVVEYENYCQNFAREMWNDMTEEQRNDQRNAYRKLMRESLRTQSRPDAQPSANVGANVPLAASTIPSDRDLDDHILADLARKETPTFERWELRQSVHQAVLPFAQTA